MPVCVCEARPGGKIRYEWTNPRKGSFYVTGEFLELVPYSKIVHVERMHLPDPPRTTMLKPDLTPTAPARE